VKAFRGGGFDVAMRLVDARAKLFQPENVQVDGPVPDGAAARQRNARAPATGHQRPSTRLEARMVLTNSYGASGQTMLGVWSRTASPCASTVDPISTSSRSIVRISRTRGMRFRISGFSVSSAAASAGSAEFFDPLAGSPLGAWSHR